VEAATRYNFRPSFSFDFFFFLFVRFLISERRLRGVFPCIYKTETMALTKNSFQP
jgi:hypothetical protein